MAVDLVVCVATELEGSMLRPHVPVLCTGVGAVNAAYTLTRFLERQHARSVIVCGVAGAYPRVFSEEGLHTGSVACAESECYGDLGAQSAKGFLDMQALGFPVIQSAEPIYNVLPMQIFPAPRKFRFVTMNTCTGDDESARRLEIRTGGAVESMEGAAIAHVAALFQIPVGEIRGISNRAGNRDRTTWRVQDAAIAAQEALLAWMAQR
ncbi:MAG: futalosine hydrolase [Acidobacteriota bacterium]|nr:futalosine hydrolase [Acidobacteriota bacterium]